MADKNATLVRNSTSRNCSPKNVHNTLEIRHHGSDTTRRTDCQVHVCPSRPDDPNPKSNRPGLQKSSWKCASQKTCADFCVSWFFCTKANSYFSQTLSSALMVTGPVMIVGQKESNQDRIPNTLPSCPLKQEVEYAEPLGLKLGVQLRTVAQPSPQTRTSFLERKPWWKPGPSR